MSNTPKTDDAVIFAISQGMRLAPLAEFARELERLLTDEKRVRRNAEQVTMDAIAKRDQAINDRNLAWAERDNLRAENAALWSSATKLIQNNGGPLQSDEAVERDGQDDYVMVKVQDFEALCAAIDAARKEQP